MERKYTFTASCTHKAYKHKPIVDKALKINEYKDMVFSRKEYTIEKFIEDVKSGYSFAYCFNDNNRQFKCSLKNDKNFSSTKIIAVDIDDNLISMNEFIEQLPLKPTIAYTSPSNMQEGKGYRFRMVYCFDDEIKSVNEYKRVYYYLIDKNSIKLEDNCMQSPSQLYNGNANDNIEIYQSDNIYNLKNIINSLESINQIKKENDIQINLNDTDDKYEQLKKEVSNRLKKENDVQINLNDTNVKFDKDYISDFYRLNRTKFLLKYNYFLLDVKRESELVAQDSRYSIYPSDYVRVPIKYRSRKNIKKHIRFKDGEKRHKFIHIAGLVFKKLNPTVTAEQMLYLLVDEIYNNYDNSDRKFDCNYMIKLTIQVMNEPIELLEEMKMHNMPKYRVNKDFCAATFQSACSVSNQIRREQRYKEIDKYYDKSKTQKENLEILQQNNVKCSIATLKRYVKYRKETHYSSDSPYYIFEMTKLPIQNKKKKK